MRKYEVDLFERDEDMAEVDYSTLKISGLRMFVELRELRSNEATRISSYI